MNSNRVIMPIVIPIWVNTLKLVNVSLCRLSMWFFLHPPFWLTWKTISFVSLYPTCILMFLPFVSVSSCTQVYCRPKLYCVHYFGLTLNFLLKPLSSSHLDQTYYRLGIRFSTLKKWLIIVFENQLSFQKVL
jgi:hypothetical protein